jgi:hypothetical protein
VATLTFVYAESTAVVGPLATTDEPHSWDLCEDHALRITVPRGWEMLRSERGFSAPVAEDYELTALAEAVREVGGRSGVAAERMAGFDGLDEARTNRHRRAGFSPRLPGESIYDRPARGDAGVVQPLPPVKPRPGRRGHLRVLPDPVD